MEKKRSRLKTQIGGKTYACPGCGGTGVRVRRTPCAVTWNVKYFRALGDAVVSMRSSACPDIDEEGAIVSYFCADCGREVTQEELKALEAEEIADFKRFMQAGKEVQ